MQAGVLGLPDYDFGELESYSESKEIGEGRSLQACLEIRQTERTNGITVQTGRAALEELGTEEQISIDLNDNSVSVRESVDVKSTKYTEFITVPGEFVAVSNNSGTFAFRLIAGQTDAANISSASIDLDSLTQSYMDSEGEGGVNPWQVGFYGSETNAEKGTLYGNEVLSDSEIGGMIRHLPKNQVGLEIGGGEIKMTATESGYVEVYQPSNYDSVEFAQFILEHILPHSTPKRE
jgi:hypothetical protein